MGRDLVTWLQNLLQPTRSVGEDGDAPLSRTYSRYNICGMWQVLHEEGLIYHGEFAFRWICGVKLPPNLLHKK